MCVENEPANVRFLQKRFHAWCVGAFRQPKTDWLCSEDIHIYISSDQNLRARLVGLLEKRKEAVGGGASNDFKYARFTQFAKSGEQIAFLFLPKETLAFREDLEIKVGEFAKF